MGLHGGGGRNREELVTLGGRIDGADRGKGDQSPSGGVGQKDPVEFDEVT